MNDVLLQSALADPAALALLPSDAVVGWGTTLAVAPHPDDESLGCGGTLALLRQHNVPVHVLVVSDGTGSHPNSQRYPAPALRMLREQETVAVLRILGVGAPDITFLRLQDTAVPMPGEQAFADAVVRVRAVIEGIQPRTVLVPWRRDPHCDHRASWHLLHAALPEERTAPRVLEYPIWVWALAASGDAPLPNEVHPWRLDITPVVPHKQAAIAAHRSQTTDLIDDDPQGFRLLPEVLAHFRHPWELYLETMHDTTV